MDMPAAACRSSVPVAASTWLILKVSFPRGSAAIAGGFWPRIFHAWSKRFWRRRNRNPRPRPRIDRGAERLLPAEHTKKDQVGLCARCMHVRIVRSDRGSVFYQCQRAAYDPDFPRYPRLPVLRCKGYEPGGPSITAKKPEPT